MIVVIEPVMMSISVEVDGVQISEDIVPPTTVFVDICPEIQVGQTVIDITMPDIYTVEVQPMDKYDIELIDPFKISIIEIMSPGGGGGEYVKKWKVLDTETYQVVSYIGQENKDDGRWAIVKVYEDVEVHIKYATKKNNPNISTYSQAWNNRTSLTYTDYNLAF